ncbi:MAG TPA: sigma-54 dependent transcriptional regulator [Phycisphaerae bacterium]|nr:sigma-54 dependent transcriptional regulator [Phycisphaerae bacterium]
MKDSVHPNVLIVGCDGPTTRLLLEVLAARGIRGTVARDAKAARDHLEQGRWDLVLAELDAPQGGGMGVVEEAKLRGPELPVVMLARRGAVPTVVRALRAGCEDYLVEPLERPAIEQMLDSLLPNRPVPVADGADDGAPSPYRIVGRSPALLEAVALAKKVAPTSAPVLIAGESGTGKELIAHLVHQASRRAAGPYVRVNCAALSESLLESELFGHERGAFTGAVIERKGRFELANGGTLLLDEITETGPRLQAELLRVLDQQDFERVGGSQPIRVSVRIISTTNTDLGRLVRLGRFRADLYYRLAGVRLTVPPLRHRKEDIPVLAWHFVNEFAREVRRSIRQLDPDMMHLYYQYPWPGNVRQLRNMVRTGLILGSSDVLSLAEAPWLRAELAPAAPGDGQASLRLRDVERRAILEAFRITNRNQVKAAALLGITDRTLREKLRRYRQKDAVQEREDMQCLKEPA